MELAGLFLASFLAATLLPGGSEALLLVLVNQSPLEWLSLIAVASVGNSLGSLSSYGLGYVGRVKFTKAQYQSRSAALIDKFGVWSLFLSWLPVVGDLLCVLAGYFKLPLGMSLLFIFIGKTLRYCLVVYGFSLFT